jgi:hypothetical protein
MSPTEASKIIISNLDSNFKEFSTIPKINRKPVWFSASTNGEVILINNANEREKGEPVSKEVTAITLNQVYYFYLIKYQCGM